MEVRNISKRRIRARGRKRRDFSERFDQHRTGNAPVGTPFEHDAALTDTELCHLIFEPYQDVTAVVGYM